MKSNWIKKYQFKIAALMILLGFFVGLVFIQAAAEEDMEAERQNWLNRMNMEKISISDAEGFTNGTVILTATLTSGNESAQIFISILKDSHGNTIEVIDSIHEEIPLSEETQVSVTFNTENIQLTDDYTITLCSEKGGQFVSESFKFSNTD
ncbi:MAG: hypothetical protein P8Y18_09975 [Candidatus Bathyarchaeota archaeon]